MGHLSDIQEPSRYYDESELDFPAPVLQQGPRISAKSLDKAPIQLIDACKRGITVPFACRADEMVWSGRCRVQAIVYGLDGYTVTVTPVGRVAAHVVSAGERA